MFCKKNGEVKGQIIAAPPHVYRSDNSHNNIRNMQNTAHNNHTELQLNPYALHTSNAAKQSMHRQERDRVNDITN